MTKKNKIVMDEQHGDVNKNIEDVISNVEPTIEEVIEENNAIVNEDIEEILPVEIPNKEIIVEEPLNVEVTAEINKPKRSIESLSKDEYRTYLRTGRIPE